MKFEVKSTQIHQFVATVANIKNFRHKEVLLSYLKERLFWWLLLISLWWALESPWRQASWWAGEGLGEVRWEVSLIEVILWEKEGSMFKFILFCFLTVSKCDQVPQLQLPGLPWHDELYQQTVSQKPPSLLYVVFVGIFYHHNGKGN